MSNDRISEWCVANAVEENSRTVQALSRCFLVGLRVTTSMLSQVSQYPDRDLNTVSPALSCE